MATLKILSWNIEHFNGGGGIDPATKAARKNRVKDVVTFLSTQDPDIFGISEVEGSLVFQEFTRNLPGYTFHITEGEQSQEILIGCRNTLTAFFTQRNEFKRNNPYLRPGALLTITVGTVDIPILFAHLKSMPSPEGFGLRDAMFEKVFNLKKALDKASKGLSGGPANFIVLGDMNTMGFDYERSDFDIPSDDEIRIITNRFKRRKMKALEKSNPTTFNNGSQSKYPKTNLDHVFAANHLDFVQQPGGFDVRVMGWAEIQNVSGQDAWIEKFSDHAPIAFELKVPQ